MLLGRADEQAVLTSELSRAGQGSPSMVVLEGDGGIGKTALLRGWLADHGGSNSVVVQAEETESALDFSVLASLLHLSGSDATGLDGRTAGRAVLALIDKLQADQHGAAVLALDDAHWCDQASLSALTFAVRRLRTDRLLLVLAARPVWPVAAHRALSDALTVTGGQRFTLRGLDVEAVRALAAQHGHRTITPTRAAELRQHTDGNPLHLLELFRTMPPDRLASTDPLPAPPTIAATVGQQLADSSPTARTLVAAVAVIGGQPSLTLARAVADLPGGHAELTEAVDRGLLDVTTTTAGQQLGVHPLVAAAVRDSLRPDELAGLHRRAAAHVDSAAGRLRHRIAAADRDDPDLVADLVSYARQQGGRGAWTSAVVHLGAAADLEIDPRRRDALRLEAAECSLTAADRARAESLLARVDDVEAPAAQYLRGWLALLSGHVEQARSQLFTAWRAAGQRHERALAGRIAHLMALLHITLGQGAAAVRWATRAVQDAHGLSSYCNAAAMLALGLAICGRGRQALVLLDHIEASLLGAPVELAGARGALRLHAGDLDGARQSLRAGLHELQRHGGNHMVEEILANLAEVETRAGRWDEAVLYAQLFLSTASDDHRRWMPAPGFAIAAAVPARRGQWDEAQRLVDTATALARTTGDPMSIQYAATAEAQLADSRGDPQAVVAATEVLVGMVERNVTGAGEPGVFDWPELRADALVRLRQLARARAEVDHLERLARQRRLDAALAAACRVRGVLAAAEQDRHAAAHFQTALDRFDELRLPFPLGRTLLDFGTALHRRGDTAQARPLLTRAHAIFEQLGARPWSERVDAVLVSTDQPGPRHDATATTGLRPQELAIAMLIARGLTNREIAQEMFLSVKTVESHLSHVYRRLEVRSRGQLAALVASAGSQAMTSRAGRPGVDALATPMDAGATGLGAQPNARSTRSAATR